MEEREGEGQDRGKEAETMVVFPIGFCMVRLNTDPKPPSAWTLILPRHCTPWVFPEHSPVRSQIATCWGSEPEVLRKEDEPTGWDVSRCSKEEMVTNT